MVNMRDRMARARRMEQAGDLAGAIAQYRKTLALQEETSGVADLGLYNRIGDLYLKSGDLSSAISAYEEAASQYEAQQLYANAVALCKKILRNAPGYLAAYRRAGRLLALSGLHAEARMHYLEYAARLEREGNLADALRGLEELVELTGDEEARLSLVDHYMAVGRTHEGLRQLTAVWQDRTERGVGADEIRERILAFDAGADPARVDAPDAASIRPSTAATGSSEPDAPMTPEPSSADVEVDDIGVEGLAGELRDVLRELEGEEKLRQALPIVTQLLKLGPGKVELLHRKLAYALQLGEEEAAIEAYLDLGAALERRLESFSVRFLTSSASGGVTTAIRIEDRTAAAVAERDA